MDAFTNIHYAYKIGSTVYEVANPHELFQSRLEPGINTWKIDGVGSDGHGRPMYHVIPADTTSCLKLERFILEKDLLPDLKTARLKKVCLWQKNIFNAAGLEMKKMEDWIKMLEVL